MVAVLQWRLEAGLDIFSWAESKRKMRRLVETTPTGIALSLSILYFIALYELMSHTYIASHYSHTRTWLKPDVLAKRAVKLPMQFAYRLFYNTNVDNHEYIMPYIFTIFEPFVFFSWLTS